MERKTGGRTDGLINEEDARIRGPRVRVVRGAFGVADLAWTYEKRTVSVSRFKRNSGTDDEQVDRAEGIRTKLEEQADGTRAARS
jgi:hypothetical protein